MNKNIEVEGGEIAIRNSHGDLAIIPKDKRNWIKQKLSEGCHGCIDSLVETLPVMEDYAQDGTLLPNNTGKLMNYDKNTDTYIATPLKEVTITTEAPQWLKYKREYEKNNPKKDYINKYLTPFAKSLGNTETNYPKRLDAEYEQKSLDYIGEQLFKNKPQGKLSRAEWLNQMSDKEQEIIKRNPKYQSSLWADTKRGLTSLVEQNPLQTFQNILNSSDYTNREKQEMLKDYAQHPMMSKLGDAAKILNPLTVPSKIVQSAYKDDYSFTDALKGKKNNAGIVEDIVTDPLNLVGVGLAGKLSKADKAIDATKVGSKVVGKGDDVVKLVERKQVFDKETLDAIDRYNKYFGKNDPNSTLTMADKIKIGRDVVSRKNLEKAYRNTHIEEILDARKKGYFNNEKFPDTDWYYGGSSSKYGNIEIEAVPDSKFFRLFEVDGKYVGIVTPDKEILHLKGTNVPYEGVVIRYKGKELSDDMLERISKIYKKGDNLDEIISKAGNKVLNKTDDVIKSTVYNEGENKILDFFTPKNTKKVSSEFTFENIPDRKFNTLNDFKTKYKSDYQVTTDKRTFKGEALDVTRTGKEESNYFTRNVDDKIEKHYNNEITLQKFKDYGGDEKSFQTLIDNINTPSKTVQGSLNGASGLLTDEGVSLAIHNKYLDPNEAMQTLFHEKGHQSKIVAPTKEGSLLPNLWEDISKLSGYSKYTSADKGSIGMYMDHPSEIYSRIMELKYKANLKPYENFTKELLEKIGGVERDASGKITRMSGLMPSSYSKNEERWLKLINKAPVLIPAIGSGMYFQSQEQNKSEQ